MAVAKRIRFEVFKRDAFQCQYCGRKPPEIVLEVDHIVARANGGQDDISNLLTACFDCNRGKGATVLDSAPRSLAPNLEELKEKRDQMVAYNQFLLERQLEAETAIASVSYAFSWHFPGWVPGPAFEAHTIKRFLELLPMVKVVEAMDKACLKFRKEYDVTGRKTNEKDSWIAECQRRDRGSALRYFCGICWNWIKHPEKRGW